MEVDVRPITGPWEKGYVLDRHTIRSVPLDHSEHAHRRFENSRTELGEAVFQLKYRERWAKAEPIAKALKEHILPLLPHIDLIVPVPASTQRPRQPVEQIATELGRRARITVSKRLIQTRHIRPHTPPLKNLTTKEEKDAALKGRFSIDVAVPVTRNASVLVLDDLFETGATMGAICTILQSHPKVATVYAAAVTMTGMR